MATGRVPTTANSPLTAKGDLFTYSTAPARLAVGNSGEQIVADSSTSTGLRYQAPKTQNAVYNSGFDTWQRGTSVTFGNGAAGVGYTADRWQGVQTGGTGSSTASRQATGDTTNLPNIQYCARVQRNSGQTLTAAVNYIQTLETADSIRFTGQTVTFSFYARAGANFSAASSALAINVYSGTGTDQNVIYSFTGATAIIATTKTLTTTWQRFTATATVSTGATEIGYWFAYTPVGTAGANDYFEVTGVQLEVGSVATPFNRMSGTIQGELAACQRYYYRQTADATAVYAHLGQSRGDGATSAVGQTVLPVTMRVTPTSVDYATVAVTDGAAVYAATAVALASNQNNAKFAAYTMTFASGVTQFRYYYVVSNNSATGYLGFSAEL